MGTNEHEGPRARGWIGALAVAGAVVGLAAAACDVEPRDGIEPRDAELPLQQPVPGVRVPAPLPGAHCSIQVDGVGTLDMEDDYLPHVIQCENGGANLEALKAQAISARSVAYYNIETSGSICDSQGCQVYSCGSTPQAIHYQAVQETSGVYLNYNDTLTYGFYVAGDNNTAPPACVGVSGATEGWVTYNQGNAGTSVEQTELGFVHAPGDSGYGQNRGCMSQWGARCLENDNGYDYVDILRFYYGDDIELTQGEGACVLPLPGEETGSSGEPEGTGTDAGMGTSEGGGAEGTSEGGEGAGSDAEGGSVDDGGPPGGTGVSGGSNSGDTADTITPGLPATFGATEDQEGCACRAERSPGAGGWWTLLVLGIGRLARRRRR